MKKTLLFTIKIRAPRKLVWEKMLGDDGYRVWTSAFCEGSYYWGSWDEGHSIQFLAANGDGGMAIIAENRLYEFLSIRHIGQIKNGHEDTTSDQVKSFAPAYENITLSDSIGGTQVDVSLDTLPEYEGFMQERYPAALHKLKEISEAENIAGNTTEESDTTINDVGFCATNQRNSF